MFPLLDLPDFFKMTKKRFEFFLESVIPEHIVLFSVNRNEYKRGVRSYCTLPLDPPLRAIGKELSSG